MYLVLQYDNRPLGDVLKTLINYNIAYCNKHNYKHMFVNIDFGLPPYWVKAFFIHTLLNTNKYEGILWLDTDACIHDTNIKLESMIVNDKSFYLSPDNIIWEHYSPFNAGVFFVLNNAMGKEIMSKWISCYNPNLWVKDNQNIWTTTVGHWGGEAYEQGSFTSHVLPIYSNHIHRFEWNYFQSTYSSIHRHKNTPVFSVHFCCDKDNIYNYIMDFQQSA